jgi:phytoene dehydrogenase-like protein
MDSSKDVATDVVVIGAGVAGLTAARLARAAGLDVLVVDGHGPGGRGATDERGGFALNRGPRALYLGGPAERVLSALAVPLPGGAPPQPTWVRDGDRVVPLPAGPVSLLRTDLLDRRGKVAVGVLLGRLARIDAGSLCSMTLAQWLDDVGVPDDARRLLEMLARLATYCHAPDLVSADVVVTMLQQALGAGVRYLDGGWGSMVAALAGDLTVATDAAEEVRDDGGRVVVTTSHRRIVAGAAVVAAGTPSVTARLCGRAPFEVGPPVEASCLDLGTSAPAARPILLGFDAPLYASDHGAAARLAPTGHSVVHVLRYLTPGDGVDQTELRSQLEDHASAAGVALEQVVVSRRLHRMVVAGALPTATRGGLAGRPAVDDTGVPGVWMAADWVGPVGHLLDASVASAEAAAAAAVRRVARRRNGKLSA